MVLQFASYFFFKSFSDIQKILIFFITDLFF